MSFYKIKIGVLAAAGALCVGLFTGSGAVPAHAMSQAAPGQIDGQQTQREAAQPETKTVIGTVIKLPESKSMPGDTYIIYDENTDLSYFLDHPSAVARLQGQRARVQGTLNETDNTIQVQSIESVPALAEK